MTATEQLRKLLDERGVGTYKHEVPEAVCLAYFDGARWHDCWESTGGEVNVTFSMTPEQAVAATLGQEDTYTREDVEGAFVSGYSLGCLPVGSDPQWDENRQTVDEHMSELGWVRKDAATARDADTSRWHELFGTPERAARTLQGMCDGSENCQDLCCPALQDTKAPCGTYDLMLEWLRGDA